MFWVQETATNKNNAGYKLFYAETLNDIDLMPTNEKKGTQENGDTVANHICSLGSKCLCLENGDYYILSTSGWSRINTKGTSGNTGGDNGNSGNNGCNCEGITIVQNDDTEPIPNREILSLFSDTGEGSSDSGGSNSEDKNQLDIEHIPHEKIESLFS